jgi:hypothetical protein
LATGVLTFGVAPTSNAGERFKEGNWRLELSSTAGFSSRTRDRRGDVFTNLIVEYEVPLSDRFTLGLRILPAFLYAQGSGGDPSFYGAGFGLAPRVYQHKEDHRGFFAEVQGHVIIHNNKLRGNTGGANFLTGAGVGYKFKNDWHTVFKIEHISNAGLASRNAGANLLGIGFGYTF